MESFNIIPGIIRCFVNDGSKKGLILTVMVRNYIIIKIFELIICYEKADFKFGIIERLTDP